MATKWNDTLKNVNAAFFSTTGKTILACSGLGLAVAFMLSTLCIYGAVLPIYVIAPFCLAAAFCLALAVYLVYRSYLNSAYPRKQRQSNDSFRAWELFYHGQHCFFLPVLGALLLVSAFLYYWVWDFTYNFNPIYYCSNDYAVFFSVYLLFFLPIWLFAVCEWILYRFMHRQLNAMMAGIQEDHRKTVEAAVKSQEESIAAAVKSEKLKVELISNVSHDLKTPLTSMVGYIDLLKKEELNDTASDYVEVLSAKAEKLKEMIESLFSLAKTSSGNIELKPEPLNLNRLIEQIYADMEDRIRESGLEFVTELTAADTELVTDSSYLYRICQNLIENALKYSALHTRVFLKTSSTPSDKGRTIRFEITNTSAYRMNFTKEQIVERFARGDKARSSEGNGLGLAIVCTYTSALGGHFDVFIDCDQFKAIVEFEKAAPSDSKQIADIEQTAAPGTTGQ